MARVLVVDDEAVYRRQLSDALGSDGHAVETASSGRRAIDIAARSHPQVVVTDWMLRGPIHGLHVVEVICAVDPDTRTVMITGFGTDDLRQGAESAGISEFIEKPFGRDRIRSAVRAVLASPPRRRQSPLLATLEVDSAGAIKSANDHAKQLLDATDAGRGAPDLASVFCSHTMPDLDEAATHWVAVSRRAAEPAEWQVRAQQPCEDGSRLVVLCREGESPRPGPGLIEMLLGFRAPELARWPVDGRVLVVDDEALVRRMVRSMLEMHGAVCYTASTADEAVRLLENDSGLKFVVHDHDMPDCDTGRSVERIRTVRPDVVVVGNSGVDRSDDFAAIGVRHFLQKPWRAGDLVNVLMGRIGNCVDCGIPVPLRRMKPGEIGERWICAYCGMVYHAMLDETSPPGIQHNVRPDDQP